MYIARQKRRENIAEYILYLWQLEDLLRALGSDPEKIFATLVEPRTDLNDRQKQELLSWYMDTVNILAVEAKAEHGHAEHTMHLISELNDLHLHLLKSPAGKEYASLFARLEPELQTIHGKLGKENINDIELCFRALYSLMLYRMKGESGRVDSDIMELISPVISKLAQIYHAAERGEIDLYAKNKNSENEALYR